MQGQGHLRKWRPCRQSGGWGKAAPLGLRHGRPSPASRHVGVRLSSPSALRGATCSCTTLLGRCLARHRGQRHGFGNPRCPYAGCAGSPSCTRGAGSKKPQGPRGGPVAVHGRPLTGQGLNSRCPQGHASSWRWGLCPASSSVWQPQAPLGLWPRHPNLHPCPAPSSDEAPRPSAASAYRGSTAQPPLPHEVAFTGPQGTWT